jgi:hypothetical protein
MSYIGAEPTTVAFLTDTFSGNGSTVAFTMQVAPATTSSVLVAITGVLQDPSTYSVVGTTLTFSQAPPTGTSNISVRYLGIPASGVTTTAYRTVTDFTATAGQTTFSVPSYTVGYIDVYRNGVRLAAADYTATNGTTVVLANAATLNDSVVTESFYVSSVLNAIPATAGAVNTTNIADNAITTAKIAPGAVVQADLATGVAGTGPAFSAYPLSSQSIPNATFTKLQVNTEFFDTNGNFDVSNYRFTPTVAGYYQFTGAWYANTSAGQVIATIYKNGTAYQGASLQFSAGGLQPCVNSLVYLNGSTDYVELYVYQSQGSAYSTLAGRSDIYYFQGFLARAA